MLIEAEESAKKTVEIATKNKREKMRGAAAKAEEDLKKFREEQQAEFDKTTKDKKNFDAKKELDAETNAEKAVVQKDYDGNKKKTVKYIVSKILDVPITLTDTQTQSLKTGKV